MQAAICKDLQDLGNNKAGVAWLKGLSSAASPAWGRRRGISLLCKADAGSASGMQDGVPGLPREPGAGWDALSGDFGKNKIVREVLES